MIDDVRAPRQIRHRQVGMGVEDRAEDEVARDSGAGRLAGGIHIGQHEGVGTAKGVREITP